MLVVHSMTITHVTLLCMIFLSLFIYIHGVHRGCLRAVHKCTNSGLADFQFGNVSSRGYNTLGMTML